MPARYLPQDAHRIYLIRSISKRGDMTTYQTPSNIARSMIMKLHNVFVCNRRSSVLLERFLIASVTTVLVIRFYLAATGYPQVGGGGLHISHLLWGGLDLLVALVLSLAFLGRRMQSLVALLGGI